MRRGDTPTDYDDQYFVTNPDYVLISPGSPLASAASSGPWPPVSV